MEAFLISAGLVALAELGDKSMLLGLAVAARFRKPVPIVLGLLVATLLNHSLAGAVGGWLAAVVSPDTLRWIIAVSFIGMGLWVLVPEKDERSSVERTYGSAFVTAAVVYFLAEMGDKTQLATAALVARFETFVPVVAGTTLGMIVVNLPVILAGSRYAGRLPKRTIRLVCAGLFIALGVSGFFWIG